jgi:hypothetical protein
MVDRIAVLIADMAERQRRLLRLREPRRRTTKAERIMDRIVGGDRSDEKWQRKRERRIQRGKLKKLGKLGAASKVRKVDVVTGEVIKP